MVKLSLMLGVKVHTDCSVHQVKVSRSVGKGERV